MSDHLMPQHQDSTADDELSTQELEEVAGGDQGVDSNGNCGCTNNGCTVEPAPGVDN